MPLSSGSFLMCRVCKFLHSGSVLFLSLLAKCVCVPSTHVHPYGNQDMRADDVVGRQECMPGLCRTDSV